MAERLAGLRRQYAELGRQIAARETEMEAFLDKELSANEAPTDKERVQAALAIGRADKESVQAALAGDAEQG